jgi:hypothetical protein
MPNIDRARTRWLPFHDSNLPPSINEMIGLFEDDRWGTYRVNDRDLAHIRESRILRTSRRSALLLGVAVLCSVIGACVIDGPLTADWKGQNYTAGWTEVPKDRLGSGLQGADSSLYGTVDARELVGEDPGDALALLIPGSQCANEEATWLLFWNSGLPGETIDRIVRAVSDAKKSSE